MSERIRIGVVQLNSTSDDDANFDVIAQYANAAARQGCDVVMFPECAPLMMPDEDRLHESQPRDGTQMNFCADVASANKIGLLIGSYAEMVDEDAYRFANTSIFFDRKGKRQAYYRKAHLYEAQLPGQSYNEKKHVYAGDGKPVVVDFESWKFGLSICYDLRFPEMYRTLMDAGADVLCVPSAFTYETGAAHWEVLLRARAIENTAYVVAPAQTGENYPGRRTWGHSMVVSPWGDVVAQRGMEPGVIVIDLEREQLENARAMNPSLKNRRHHVRLYEK